MSFLDEIAAQLQAQGVGIVGVNILQSSKSIVPSDDGPYLTLIETGGVAPTSVQNKTSASTQRPTAQVMVRGTLEVATRTMISAAYTALHGTYNAVLSGTFYLWILARQEPTDMGLDSNGRIQFIFNIGVEKAPS